MYTFSNFCYIIYNTLFLKMTIGGQNQGTFCIYMSVVFHYFLVSLQNLKYYHIFQWRHACGVCYLHGLSYDRLFLYVIH